MDMRFRFDQNKAIEALAYLVAHLTSVEKVKLMKLMYLADRSHFLQYGYPITGDKQSALPHGPVPSNTLDVLNGEWPNPDFAYRFLHIDDNMVMLRRDPGFGHLSKEEIATLGEILKQYGNFGPWDLVNHTHTLPEYREAYAMAVQRGCKSQPIPYESILKHSGDEAHFQLNRPVVSHLSVPHLLCPFNAGSDADL